MNALRPDWRYQGAEAGRLVALNPVQQSYAITLRRQLAESLAKAAARRALGDTSPAGSEWTRISAACRREVRRMERADAALARAQGGAA